MPALDKAFDVLELLARARDALSQTEIAEAVGRSVGQIFRVLTALEARGWILRDRASGLYSFSMGAFDLAHRHPPLRGLLVAATPAMRELSERVRQSCNLSVLDMGAVRVVAQVESPADFGYRVRVGALFPLESATGTVLTTGEAVRRDDPQQAGDHRSRAAGARRPRCRACGAHRAVRRHDASARCPSRMCSRPHRGPPTRSRSASGGVLRAPHDKLRP